MAIYEDISPFPGILETGEINSIAQVLNKYLLNVQSKNDGICRRKGKEGRERRRKEVWGGEGWKETEKLFKTI